MSPYVQNPDPYGALGLRLSHTRVSVATIKISLPVTSQTRFQCMKPGLPWLGHNLSVWPYRPGFWGLWSTSQIR